MKGQYKAALVWCVICLPVGLTMLAISWLIDKMEEASDNLKVELASVAAKVAPERK